MSSSVSADVVFRRELVNVRGLLVEDVDSLLQLLYLLMQACDLMLALCG